MSIPEISGKYQFQVDLSSSRLPVSFTIPDIPDSPPSDEYLVPNPSLVAADKRADSVVISDAHTLSTHTDSPSTAVDMEVDRANLLSVSASPTCDIRPDRVRAQDHGISVHSNVIRKTQIKYRWFYFQGKHSRLDNPSDITGVDRLRLLEEFKPFDVFVHAYSAAGAGQSHNEHITQLWVWEPLKSFSTSRGYGWKPVSAGYVCPGPGGLEGRHLVMTDHRKPTWILGATVYRRYKEVHPYTTGNANELG